MTEPKCPCLRGRPRRSRVGSLTASGLALLCATGCWSEDGGSAAVVVSYPPADEPPWPIDVVYADDRRVVWVAEATSPSEALWSLDALWAASGHEASLSTLVVELEAADGYRPSHLGCPAVAASALTRGWIVRSSRDVQWDAELNHGNCYWVRELRLLQAYDVAGEGW